MIENIKIGCTVSKDQVIRFFTEDIDAEIRELANAMVQAIKEMGRRVVRADGVDRRAHRTSRQEGGLQ